MAKDYGTVEDMLKVRVKKYPPCAARLAVKDGIAQWDLVEECTGRHCFQCKAGFSYTRDKNDHIDWIGCGYESPFDKAKIAQLEREEEERNDRIRESEYLFEIGVA